jgi:hypothetical protein
MQLQLCRGQTNLMVEHSNHHVNQVHREFGPDQVEPIVYVEIVLTRQVDLREREVMCVHEIMSELTVWVIQIENENGGFSEKWGVLKLKPVDRNEEYRCTSLAIREVFLGNEVGDLLVIEILRVGDFLVEMRGDAEVRLARKNVE